MQNYLKNIDVCIQNIVSEINIDLIQGFFRQITSPNVIASQVKLTELFEILLKVTDKKKTILLRAFLLFLVT